MNDYLFFSILIYVLSFFISSSLVENILVGNYLCSIIIEKVSIESLFEGINIIYE